MQKQKKRGLYQEDHWIGVDKQSHLIFGIRSASFLDDNQMTIALLYTVPTRRPVSCELPRPLHFRIASRLTLEKSLSTWLHGDILYYQYNIMHITVWISFAGRKTDLGVNEGFKYFRCCFDVFQGLNLEWVQAKSSWSLSILVLRVHCLSILWSNSVRI